MTTSDTMKETPSSDTATSEGATPSLDDPASVCDHRDERGSTVMQATDDRYECIVCGTRFRLQAVNAYDRLRQVEAAARELVAEPWKSAAGKPSRADLTAALRESLR